MSAQRSGRRVVATRVVVAVGTTAIVVVAAAVAVMSRSAVHAGALITATVLQAAAWRVLLRHTQPQDRGTPEISDAVWAARIGDLTPAQVPSDAAFPSPAPAPLGLAMAGAPHEAHDDTGELLIDLTRHEVAAGQDRPAGSRRPAPSPEGAG